MKNIDKIKEMTPKELAELIEKQPCDVCAFQLYKDCDDMDCEEGIIAWLEREVVPTLYEIDKSAILSEEDIEGRVVRELEFYEKKELDKMTCSGNCGKCTCKETEARRFEVVDDDFRVFPFEEIIIPQRGDDGSAGYDLRIPCDVVIKPHSHSELIFTDVRVKMHKDEYLQLHVRSSIGCKKGLVLANATGIIDYSYYYSDNQGNIAVKFYNTTDKIVRLEKGERVCQGIFQKYFITDNDQPLKECRTGSGFGSSGEK